MRIFIFVIFAYLYIIAQPNTKAQESLLVQNEKLQLEKKRKLIDNVIENINNKSYRKTLRTKDLTREKLELLENKITINTNQNNTLAVKRDQLEVMLIEEKILYENTLKEIIKAKEEFKKISFYEQLLSNTVKKIKQKPLQKYTTIYNKHKTYSSTISQAFCKNYENLVHKRNQHLYILNYLQKNISKFRQTNFFIDEFNLQSIIKKIDSLEYIEYFSNITSYHFKFSIGEIVVVVFIFALIRLLSLKVIYYIVKFIAKIFIQTKHSRDETDKIREYFKTSIRLPLVLSLYLLSIQIAIYILIKDISLIALLQPWINTTYVALLSWAVYTILDNSTNNYAQDFLEKHPTVRKEIIIFSLRIIKIILIVFVIVFFFTQLGVDIKAIIASLGIGGIAIALAAKDTLANFFGSLSIMADNSFSQGDWIKTGDMEGIVVDIKMRTTRIRTFDNGMITVPNSHLSNTNITNWSKRIIGRRIYMNIAITYESQMENIVHLKNDIKQMLENHPKIATENNSQVSKGLGFEAIERESHLGIMRTLFVFIDEYSSSSINIMVYCFSKSPNWEEWLATKEDVIIKISQLVKDNNCQFAYPTQTLWMKNKDNNPKAKYL